MSQKDCLIQPLKSLIVFKLVQKYINQLRCKLYNLNNSSKKMSIDCKIHYKFWSNRHNSNNNFYWAITRYLMLAWMILKMLIKVEAFSKVWKSFGKSSQPAPASNGKTWQEAVFVIILEPRTAFDGFSDWTQTIVWVMMILVDGCCQSQTYIHPVAETITFIFVFRVIWLRLLYVL